MYQITLGGVVVEMTPYGIAELVHAGLADSHTVNLYRQLRGLVSFSS